MEPSLTPITTTNGTNHDSEPVPTSTFDPSIFRDYLVALLPPFIGASVAELQTLFDGEFDEHVATFAAEGSDAVHVLTVALIKRSPTLDSTTPLATQLQLMNLFGSDETPYESLHAVVSRGVKPWFDAFVGSRGQGKDGDTKMGIPMTKKKFAELELSLLHLQQNVEIPETHLVVHPVIQRAVEQARAAGSGTSIQYIPPKLLNDSSFLNTLHGHVNAWIKSIQSVTKLTGARDVSSGTASQEINFWLSLERALEGIENQLRSDEIQLVMDCLRNARRYHATVSLIADTGLKDATDLVHKYNQLMKDFPLDELLSATDLDKIQESLVLIFSHLTRKFKLSPYPIRRALPLVEAISRDFNEQLLRILTSHRLPYTPYDTFERLLNQTTNIFRTWDDLSKEFTNVARDVTRKRMERFIPIKIVPAHLKLQDRCRYLREWRKQHEQLAVMTGPTKGLGGVDGGMDMEEEVKEAYEVIKRIDVLDVTVEGTEIWVAAENAYNERVSRVENQIIARLRDRLGTARNANEMFRVFSKFNALFVRPKIRGAIQEYQTQLIDSVKEDIKHLHDKFKTQYRFSEAYHMSQMRDLPPIAGAIIWARQIDRQLLTYMKRVEDVLGKGWELYAEGQRLQGDSAAFRKKLDTRPVYEAWLHDINRRNMGVDGRLFEILRLRATGGSVSGYQLAVNFDPQIITLFKEVRNLLWLGFQVPHAISNMAKDAKRVYPHAVSLMETVRTYGQTLDLVERNKGIEWLVAEYRNEAQRMVTKGMNIRWDHFVSPFDARYVATADRDSRHIQFVREFASVVSVLQDKTNNVIDLYKDILRAVEDLSTCSYTSEAFAELLTKIQAAIDRLNLEGYANLEHWVADLDKRIETILLQRLTQTIQIWCSEFDRVDDGSFRRDILPVSNKRRGDKRTKEEKVRHPLPTLEGNLTLMPIVHEIRIQNQVIFLDPPIEHARATWISQLHDWLGVVCRLRRIQSSRYEIGLQMQGAEAVETSYTSLLTLFTDDTLQRPFSLIEIKVQQLKEYVAKWLQFQSLWDLEAEYVFNRLGDSLAHWQQLLTEIKKARSTFDTSETQKSFGVCVIDYEQVQARVNAKYDAWQRDILSRFGVKLGTAMKEMHASILKARNDLEHQSIEGLVGGTLRDVPVAYKTWGRLNANKDNVMIICHAFTGSADVEDWWGPLMGHGKAFDQSRYFIFCANALGSPYGTASPITINPETGNIYGPEFPPTTIRDDVRLHKMVLDHLGVTSVAVVIGGSMGGMAVLEWPLCSPAGYIQHIIPMATSARHSAWCISWGEAQRQSIYSDPTYQDGYYTSQPAAGLAAARMSALLTYRSRDSFESRFGRRPQIVTNSNRSSVTPPRSPCIQAPCSRDEALAAHNEGHRNAKRATLPGPEDFEQPPIFSAQSYLRYQGEKFTSRFDANCYIHITRKLDTHDIARGRVIPQPLTEAEESAALAQVLATLPPRALVISIETDGLFTTVEQREIASHVPDAELVMISSPDGHDGFLLEFEAINGHILTFLKREFPDLYSGDPDVEEVESFEIKKTSLFGEAEVDVTRW
ncbi:hypothetical protein ONZ45_g7260 [Pleurotus djamor]|nr:hypothetical protein ONZ45_g7260 [Pleurotus djamor]